MRWSGGLPDDGRVGLGGLGWMAAPSGEDELGVELFTHSGEITISGAPEKVELAKLTGEEKYHAAALKLLQGLHTLCADYSDRCTGILQKCTAAYHNDGAGRHINILYGDYFYLEALCKLAGHDARLWMCE